MSWPAPGPQNRYLRDHANLLLRSYRRLTGRELLSQELSQECPQECPQEWQDEPRDETGRALYEAPFVVVSHDLRPDPVFNYGNRIALRLFEMTWEEFTSLPSRLSAEPMHRDERARLLDTVARQGFIDDYRGIRISKLGARFTIERATVWNVIDDSDVLLGQAAAFNAWTPL